jgi:hypothetical protein
MGFLRGNQLFGGDHGAGSSSKGGEDRCTAFGALQHERKYMPRFIDGKGFLLRRINLEGSP